MVTSIATGDARTPDLGILAPLVEVDGVTDVTVNGHLNVWVDRGRGMERASVRFPSEERLRAFASGLIAAGGRHVDQATPFADVRFADGMRVHVLLPPVSRSGTQVSIRVPGRAAPSLEALRGGGMLTAAQDRALREAVRLRRNVLVTGATGAGKTTLLRALLALAPPGERIVCVEDVSELVVPHPHVVNLEARQANVEGRGAVTLSDLLRQALRMRPDRIVVGECRGPELRELLSALNTGHEGGFGTMHCNSLADVPARLMALGALADLTGEALTRQVTSAIHLVAHVRRGPRGRVVDAIGRVLERDGRVSVEPIRGLDA